MTSPTLQAIWRLRHDRPDGHRHARYIRPPPFTRWSQEGVSSAQSKLPQTTTTTTTTTTSCRAWAVDREFVYIVGSARRRRRAGGRAAAGGGGRRRDGLTDGRMDGRTDGRTIIRLPLATTTPHRPRVIALVSQAPLNECALASHGPHPFLDSAYIWKLIIFFVFLCFLCFFCFWRFFLIFLSFSLFFWVFLVFFCFSSFLLNSGLLLDSF